jgi:hypothetical protein
VTGAARCGISLDAMAVIITPPPPGRRRGARPAAIAGCVLVIAALATTVAILSGRTGSPAAAPASHPARQQSPTSQPSKPGPRGTAPITVAEVRVARQVAEVEAAKFMHTTPTSVHPWPASLSSASVLATTASRAWRYVSPEPGNVDLPARTLVVRLVGPMQIVTGHPGCGNGPCPPEPPGPPPGVTLAVNPNTAKIITLVVTVSGTMRPLPRGFVLYQR